MKDGAADADQRDRDEQQRIGVGEGEADEADQRERHAGGQERVDRPAVGHKPISGCSSEAVDWNTNVMTPVWKKVSANFSRKTG